MKKLVVLAMMVMAMTHEVRATAMPVSVDFSQDPNYEIYVAVGACLQNKVINQSVTREYAGFFSALSEANKTLIAGAIQRGELNKGNIPAVAAWCAQNKPALTGQVVPDGRGGWRQQARLSDDPAVMACIGNVDQLKAELQQIRIDIKKLRQRKQQKMKDIDDQWKICRGIYQSKGQSVPNNVQIYVSGGLQSSNQ